MINNEKQKEEEVLKEKDIEVRFVISEDDIIALNTLINTESRGRKYGIIDSTKAYDALVEKLQKAIKREEY